MRLITLMRHAKSSWEDTQLDDHDRPLNSRGRKDAPTMAQRLLARGCTPDQIYCSSAVRTRETAAVLLKTHNVPPTSLEIVDALYLASPATIRAILEDTHDSIQHLMVIGHNPGLEMLGKEFHASAPSRMPTCAASQFSLSGNSFLLDTHNEISLTFFDYPKNTAV